MSLSRRDFLRYSGASSAGAALGSRAVNLAAVEAAADKLRIKEAQVFPGVCPYCAVGCAQLIYVKDGQIIDIEGDPDTPHTEGALCPKGSSTFQLSMNERRLTKALYRAPWQHDVGREAARLDDGDDCAAREGDPRRDVCRHGQSHGP